MPRTALHRGVVLVALTPLLLVPACTSLPGLPDQGPPADTEQVDTVAAAISEPCTLITPAELSELGFYLTERRDGHGGEPTTCRIDDGDSGQHGIGVLTVAPEENDTVLGRDPTGPAPETVTIGRHQALKYTGPGSEGCLIVIEAAETTQVLVGPSESGVPCARTMSVAQVVEAKLR